ncbi:hypothetical protein J3R83DRAFT_8436 [Lanmaoa asiatica]|nr:hypothetical protein J3R83DRAFT_8436 [Lanmaoa asiatica]
MADPNLEIVPDFASPVFDLIRQGLRLGYQENDEQAVERLIIAWEANKATCVAAWNAQKEIDARIAEEAEIARRELEDEENRLAREEAEREQRETDKKKPKMNPFTPGASVADSLIHPPSHYALQKLSTFDYIELWYFTQAGRLDAAKHSSKSQADDTFGISRVDDHLTVRSIASVRASRNALSDHDLSFSEFLRAKNLFLESARKAEWPIDHLDSLAKFFWLLETHPTIQLPLGEKIILTYASRVRLDWHRELKAGRGYDISVVNQHLMRSIADEIKALDDELIKTQVRPNPFP